DSDRFGLLPAGPGVFSEGVYGYYVEAEARPWDKCRVSLLARYDSQKRSSPAAPSGSALPNGFFDVERVTLGINIELWHQSLLIVQWVRVCASTLVDCTGGLLGLGHRSRFVGRGVSHRAEGPGWDFVRPVANPTAPVRTVVPGDRAATSRHGRGHYKRA